VTETIVSRIFGHIFKQKKTTNASLCICGFTLNLPIPNGLSSKTPARLADGLEQWKCSSFDETMRPKSWFPRAAFGQTASAAKIIKDWNIRLPC
jgi:hypothetical protein